MSGNGEDVPPFTSTVVDDDVCLQALCGMVCGLGGWDLVEAVEDGLCEGGVVREDGDVWVFGVATFFCGVVPSSCTPPLLFFGVDDVVELLEGGV